MYNGYNKIFNGHGLKALLKSPTMPNPNLAIADDDEMSNVPLVIFRDQHLPMPAPTMEAIYNMSYEKTAKKGANDTLSMQDFVTDDFQLGEEYDFLT